MATTTNLGLIQPTVGGDTDAWGGYLNSDLGYIDALFGITSTSVTLHVNNQNIASSSYKFDQIKMGDNRSLQFGAGASLAAPDYWLVYNSSGTQLELHSTNVDGSGTDGTVLKVADGTDDVSFTGQIQGASGVVAATAISVGGDTTSGFYRGGTNIVNISNAGALTASFNASNVSTIQKLSVAGDGATVTGIKDEDNMSSNSATKLATQQSIKAYVDAQVGSFDTLAEVLAAGNTTGSTDIVVTSGQKITTNTISETTGASGVTIDGVLVKDSTVTASGGFVGNATTASSSPAGALTGTTLKSAVVASSLTSVGTIGTGVWNGTAVAPGFGGTGLSSYSAGDILYATGSSTLAKLAKGSDTQVLTLASGLPSWVAPTVGDITGITAGTGLSGTDLTGPVPTLNVDASQTQITAVGTLGTGTWSATTIAVNKGGSGLTSYTAGDLLYATGSTTLAKLAKQTDGQVLTLASGLPTWATNPVGDLTAIVAGSGLTGSDLSGPIPTLNVVGTSSRISVGADAVDIDSGYVGQTSITTLGTIGTGTWRGTTVEADQGGTGKSSYTAGDLLVASSGTALAALARGASGQVLTMSGTSLTWAAPTVGDITSVVAGAGMTGGGTSGDVTLNVIGTTNKITVSSDAVTIASGYVGQGSITTLGTVGTGTWEATKVASDFLDDDTAHLSGTQTFSGAKTFSAATTLSGALTISNTAAPIVVTLEGASGSTATFDHTSSSGSIALENATGTIATFGGTGRTLTLTGEINVQGSGISAIGSTLGSNDLRLVSANGGYAGLTSGTSAAGAWDVAQDSGLEIQRWTGTASNFYGFRVGSDAADLVFSTAASAAIGSQTFTERMRILAGGGVTGSDGSAGAPAYSFTGDTNTGMYRVASDQLGFAVAGAEVFRAYPGAIRNADGSASTPAYSFISDSDTGMYRTGSGEIGLATNTGVSLRISTTEVRSERPIRVLTGSAGAPTYSFQADTDTGMYRSAANTVAFAAAGTHCLSLTASAATFPFTAYIGDTANANATLGLTINQGAADNEILSFKSSDVNQPSTNYAEADTFGFVSKAAADYGGLKFGAFTETGTDGQTFYIYAVNADAANTTKSTSGEGLVQFDAAVNSGTGSTVVGTDGNMVAFTNNGNARFLFDAEGSGHADVEWTTFSDSRLKTNVAAIPYGLAEVRDIDAKIFDKWSGKIVDGAVVFEEDSDRRMVGFIAQDVRAGMPELVKALPDDESFYSLDYGRMTPVLWSAMQELDAEVQTLKARVAALEA